jgi:TRAP-type C4-dicarboxylate transport system permease small subunit
MEMTENQSSHSKFTGTYFNKDATFKLSRAANVLSWLILAAYILEWGYTQWQSVYNAMLGGYPIDINYLFFSLPRILQGIMLLIILQAVAKVLLILLDIEDNTRRSARR